MHQDDMKDDPIHHDLHDAGEEEEKRGPIRIILALFLILLIMMMGIPYYSISVNPEPSGTAKLDIDITVGERLDTIDAVSSLRVSQTVRNAALQITSSTCDGDDVCYAKALFYYVRDDIRYISDPEREYIQSPEETLLGAGDCEDQAILLHMLMRSIGIQSRIIIIPGHAFLQIQLADAISRYRDDDGWIYLDPTCSYCGFGEVPPYNSDTIIRMIY